MLSLMNKIILLFLFCFPVWASDFDTEAYTENGFYYVWTEYKNVSLYFENNYTEIETGTYVNAIWFGASIINDNAYYEGDYIKIKFEYSF